MIARPELVENDVDPIEQDMARFKQPAMAVAGGIAAALVVATLPHVYLENIIGTTGLSEIIPAAAPPLGNTARGLVAVLMGLVSTSALYLFLNSKTKSLEGGSDMSLAIRRNLTSESRDVEHDGKSRYSLPKLNLSAKSLTKFLKKPKKSAGQVTELKDLPDVRTADSHPDAPARQPIFASSDLGAPLVEKIKPFEQPEIARNHVESDEPPAPRVVTPAPFVADKTLHSPDELEPTPVPVSVQHDNITKTEETVLPREDLTALSLAQLADRLEAGLRRLEALESRGQVVSPPASPVAQPLAVEEDIPLPQSQEEPVAVAIAPLRSVDSVKIDIQDDRQADMDAALKAALGTLERMTAQR
jgi:hypothetical protein